MLIIAYRHLKLANRPTDEDVLQASITARSSLVKASHQRPCTYVDVCDQVGTWKDRSLGVVGTLGPMRNQAFRDEFPTIFWKLNALNSVREVTYIAQTSVLSPPKAYASLLCQAK